MNKYNITKEKFWETLDDGAVDVNSHRISLYDMATFDDIKPDTIVDKELRDLYTEYYEKASELRKIGSKIFKMVKPET